MIKVLHLYDWSEKITFFNNSRLTDDKSLQALTGHKDAAFTRRQHMTPQETCLMVV
jgi:hypothetical protein